MIARYKLHADREEQALLLRSVGNFRFRLRQCRAARSPALWLILHGFACGVASNAGHNSRLARLAGAVAEHAMKEAGEWQRPVSVRIVG